MDGISLVGSTDRTTWTPLVDPPGQIPSGGRERSAFTSADGSFTCGFWEREPDTWSFERPYDEVAYILEGAAGIETDGGTLEIGPGDVLVTPNGSKGAWHINQTLTKFYAIYSGATVGDTTVCVIGRDDQVDWVTLENPPGDTNPPGREWYAWRNADGRFSTGVWQRVPETGTFEPEYTEVACLIAGDVDIERGDAEILRIGPGDVLVTPNGSKGTWHINQTLTKFYAIYSGASVGDTDVRVIGRDDPVDWVTLENPPGDTSPPGQEWYAWRNVDGRFSTGVWQRVPETGTFELSYHEIACMIEGDVEIETSDGEVLPFGPGDALVTPIGSKGVWRAKTSVRKFWAVHHE